MHILTYIYTYVQLYIHGYINTHTITLANLDKYMHTRYIHTYIST